MKRWALLSAMVVAGVLAARPAAAQIGIAPQASWGDDRHLGVGGRVNFKLAGSVLRFDLLGSFDWFVHCKNCNYYEITPAATVGLELLGIGPYVGAGLNFAHLAVDNGPKDTNTQFAVLLGARVPFGLFAEIRNTSGGGQKVVTVGFRLGI